jgi:hypothetical protein
MPKTSLFVHTTSISRSRRESDETRPTYNPDQPPHSHPHQTHPHQTSQCRRYISFYTNSPHPTLSQLHHSLSPPFCMKPTHPDMHRTRVTDHVSLYTVIVASMLSVQQSRNPHPTDRRSMHFQKSQYRHSFQHVSLGPRYIHTSSV